MRHAKAKSASECNGDRSFEESCDRKALSSDRWINEHGQASERNQLTQLNGASEGNDEREPTENNKESKLNR